MKPSRHAVLAPREGLSGASGFVESVGFGTGLWSRKHSTVFKSKVQK